jgi:hypothetical protein
MPEMRDRVEFALPPGRLVVRHATCPRGCDLMDAEHPIHGHPSIAVRATHEGRTGRIFLDPVYGGHDNLAEIEVPATGVAEFACPGCGVSLRHPDTTCAQCAAPMFLLHLPGGGFVEACLRNGCFQHRLRVVTGEQVMQQLFDRIGMDAFL